MVVNTPNDIAGCIVWLDAADSSTLYQEISVIRENIITSPDGFNTWTKSSNLALTSNSEFSPDNLLVSELLSSSTGQPVGSVNISTGILPSSIYTYSAYVKPDTLSSVFLDFTTAAGNAPGSRGGTALFVLTGTGLLSSTTVYGGTPSISATCSVTLTSNNWYRCAMSLSAFGVNIYYAQIRTTSPGGTLWVYGAQAERGGTATSYMQGAQIAPISAITANTPIGYWGNKSLISSYGNTDTTHFSVYRNALNTRPNYNATFGDNLSTVSFNGVNNYLTSYFNNIYRSQTTFVVVNVKNPSTTTVRIYSQVPSLETDTSATSHYIPVYQNGSYATGAGLRSAISYRSTSVLDNITSTHSGNTIRNFLNGVPSVTFSHDLTSNSVGGYYVSMSRVGAALTTATASTYLSGDIAEVVVYNRSLTYAERGDVEYYLAKKWNLPRTVYAVQNGNWSSGSTWSVDGYGPMWEIPLSSDSVFTNSYNVTANMNVAVSSIRNSALLPNIPLSGGTITLNNAVTLSTTTGTLVNTVSSLFFITLSPQATANIISNITGGIGTETYGILIPSTCTVNISGRVVGGPGLNSNGLVALSNTTVNVSGSISGGSGIGADGVYSLSGCSINVTGNITGGSGTSSIGVLTFQNSNVNVTGNITGGSAADAYGVHIEDTSTLRLIGNVSYGTTARCRGCNNNGTVNIYGNVFAGAGDQNNGTVNSNLSSCIVRVYGGDITASFSHGIYNNHDGAVYCYGCNITGFQGTRTDFSGAGIYNNRDGLVYVTGNVTGGNATTNSIGIYNNRYGPVYVYGNITGGLAGIGVWNQNGYGLLTCIGNFTANVSGATNVVPAIGSTETQQCHVFSGNFFEKDGAAPIRVNTYRIDPVPVNSIIQNTYTDLYTVDSLSAFYMPPASAVRMGTLFANNTQVGTCAVPSNSAVRYNTPVDNTVGVAVYDMLGVNQLFSESLSSYNAANTIGRKINTSATAESLGYLVASFTNG